MEPGLLPENGDLNHQVALFCLEETDCSRVDGLKYPIFFQRTPKTAEIKLGKSDKSNPTMVIYWGYD